MGLLEANVSDAKRAVSWGMFINIIITPMVIGMVEWQWKQNLIFPHINDLFMEHIIQKDEIEIYI